MSEPESALYAKLAAELQARALVKEGGVWDSLGRFGLRAGRALVPKSIQTLKPRMGGAMRSAGQRVGRGLGAVKDRFANFMLDANARSNFRTQQRLGELAGRPASTGVLRWLKETAGRAPTERLRPLDYAKMLFNPRLPVKGMAPSLAKPIHAMTPKDKILAGLGKTLRGARIGSTLGSAAGAVHGLGYVYPDEVAYTAYDQSFPNMRYGEYTRLRDQITGTNAPWFYQNMGRTLFSGKQDDPLGYAHGEFIRRQLLPLWQQDIQNRVRYNPGKTLFGDITRSTSPVGIGITGLERLLAHSNVFGKPKPRQAAKEIAEDVVPRLLAEPEKLENSPLTSFYRKAVPGMPEITKRMAERDIDKAWLSGVKGVSKLPVFDVDRTRKTYMEQSRTRRKVLDALEHARDQARNISNEFVEDARRRGVAAAVRKKYLDRLAREHPEVLRALITTAVRP